MSVYDLKSLKLPKLTGTPLKLFASAVENPAARGALMPGLLENGGIPTLRRLNLAEIPTYYPFVEPQNQIHAVEFKADPAENRRVFHTRPWPIMRGLTEMVKPLRWKWRRKSWQGLNRVKMVPLT